MLVVVIFGGIAGLCVIAGLSAVLSAVVGGRRAELADRRRAGGIESVADEIQRWLDGHDIDQNGPD